MAAEGERGTGPGLDDDELITAWGLFYEALNLTTPLLLEGIDPSGKELTGPWFEVLLRLQRSPGHRLPMSELARQVSLSSGGFTKLADRLERRGYLARQSCPSDRRVTYAALTPEGLELAEESRRRHVALLRTHVLEPLGAEGVREFADRARQLRDSSARTVR
ncbi:MarR family winged helix-turn-helix transcriptional regulator [Marinitenerispora sediminis]|uniref:MarR family transcriptional regulator n=1 Tax=Marinitenerispora sediminis TaxID=1931232 RepID=A0A368T7G4_9ACTN|nr:MarR family transcriptional regulator [Marinitenerispora sediminis]RCV53022.1 MarR family transcriptional regulator [Marinitenerispora sediminis]RCV56624.1 MarR family transcriptional regulator [Marinitenerispora sediminis]RCV59880.1 MarR family transcriptional regulator [Marinitenerispora sediminis]